MTHAGFAQEAGPPVQLVRQDPLDEILVGIKEVDRGRVHPRLPHRPIEWGVREPEALYSEIPFFLIDSDREVHGTESVPGRESGKLLEHEFALVKGNAPGMPRLTRGEPCPFIVAWARIRIQREPHNFRIESA